MIRKTLKPGGKEYTAGKRLGDRFVGSSHHRKGQLPPPPSFLCVSKVFHTMHDSVSGLIADC
jgi:hypothetical protein